MGHWDSSPLTSNDVGCICLASGHVIENRPHLREKMGRYQVLFHEKKNIPMVFLAQIADTRRPVAHIGVPNQYYVRIET